VGPLSLHNQESKPLINKSLPISLSTSCQFCFWTT
jgi:hypothetical protein